MKKSIKVVVNDKPYLVEIEDLNASPLDVVVNGQAYSVCLETVGEEAPAAPTVVESAYPVMPATPAAAAKPAPTAQGANVMAAPMPGVILDISVKPGDKVTYGQNLCALEAMKMKNAIRSPRDGVIAAVEVTEGQHVAFGDVMFRFA